METPAATAQDQLHHQASWGPVAAVIVTVGGFLLAQVIGVILMIIIAANIGGYGASEFDTYENKPEYIFLGSTLVSGSLFWLVYGFIRLRRGNLRMIGLRKPRLSDATRALLGYGVYFAAFIAVSVVINYQAPELMDQNQDIGFDTAATGPVLALIFGSLVVLPPLIEEFLFRGFLYAGLRRRLNFVWATLVTSMVFGLAHLYGGEGGAVIWVSAIDTFILSVVLCHLREKTGGLWAPILLHGAKNLVAFLLLFIFKVG